MDKDFKSTKYEYSAESYLEVLDTEITRIFKGLDGRY